LFEKAASKEVAMAIVMVNGGGNTPKGLEAKGEPDSILQFFVLPSLPRGVDGRDFLVWQKNLGTAVSEASSEFGLSHGADPEPQRVEIDLLGPLPFSEEFF
jgi:hypothetical protein